jgi:twitching motility protein PilT
VSIHDGETKLGAPVARFEDVLRRSVELGASDIHIKTGLPPIVRIHDVLQLLSKKEPSLTSTEIFAIAQAVVPARLQSALLGGQEIDMAYSLSGVGRFRLNVFRHRSQVGIICRFIPFNIRSVEELGLPSVLKRIAVQPRGLVLVTGPAGSGKTTTLAALLNEWNTSRGGHIVTIEDPIECLIRDRKAVITQREVGIDTEDFQSGLKNALRQDPDVIMIGEIRDRDTLQAALNAAETGHLVMSTLHTRDAAETVSRVVSLFEPGQQQQVRIQLAAVLTAVVSQRLLPRDGSRGLAAVVEILVNTARVRDCILDSSRHAEIHEAIAEGDNYGMQTFDQCLMEMLKQKAISREVAVRNSSRPSDFELRLRGVT